jgi:uncharacterized protein
MTPLAMLDTSVLVGSVVTSNKEAPTAVMLDAVLDGRLPTVFSPALIDEYARVLLSARIARRHGLSPPDVWRLLRRIIESGTSIDAPPCGVPCPDPRDQHLWDLLAAAPGAVLVTGEALLIENPPPFGRVMTPRHFVDEFLTS